MELAAWSLGFNVKIANLARAILPRPLVYAHRGGAALRPENTLAAFDHGLSLGADGLELDVHLSLDGVVVVHHDPTLERTTNAHGPVRLKTAVELAKIDAGHRFLPPDQPPLKLRRSAEALAKFPFRGCGLYVPTLREVLARYPVPLIIELKTPEPALAQAVVDELRAAGALGRVALGSFYSQALHAARSYEPRIVTGAAREETRWALYKSWVGWPIRRAGYREFQVPERAGRTRIVTRRFIEHAHRAQLAVKVWTVNERADMERLLAWGVDALISDRPDLAVQVVKARG